MADNESTEDLDEIVATMQRNYRESRDHTSPWRTEAREAYDLEAGKQWGEEDLQTLEAQNRPAVTFNRISRTINAIRGTQISNRQETRFIPREQGDAKVNELLTAAADWIRDQCDAEDEESDAFGDMCITGMGWLETRLDFERDLDGTVLIERVDPLEMYWDTKARKANLADARWIIRIVEMSKDRFEQRWPKADLDSANKAWDDAIDDRGQPHHQPYPQDAYKDARLGASGKGSKRIRVAQMQWVTYDTVYRVGQSAELLSADKFKDLKPKLEEAQIPYVKQKAARWHQAFAAGSELLEEGECPFPEGPTLRCMTYKRDRNVNHWYGLVRGMADPQRWGNKFLSQTIDILNKGAKGGIMAEADAFDDWAKAEENWARPDGIVKMRPGALSSGKVLPKPIAQLPTGLDRLIPVALDGVHEVTGIPLEFLGMVNRDQPGVLEHQRKQAGVNILAPLFDAMRRYRKEQGRVLLHFIQEYLSDGRLIRVAGKKMESYQPLVKQPGVAQYDVVVDESPTSPNMKERVFALLSEILPTLAKLGLPVPPDLLDYAPFPSALVERWKQFIQQTGGNPEQMQQQMQEMQQQTQKLTQENQQLKDKRAEAAAQIQLEREKAQAEFEIEKAKLELEQMKAENEIALERMKMESQITLERQKAESQADLEAFKANTALGMEREKAANDHQLKSEEIAHKAAQEAMANGGPMRVQMRDGNVIDIARSKDGKLEGVGAKRRKPRKMKWTRGANGAATALRIEFDDDDAADIPIEG